eukprot:1052966-Prymnesium_polylepis.1
MLRLLQAAGSASATAAIDATDPYEVRAASAGPRMHARNAKCLPHATGSTHDAAHAAGCATCR